MKSRSVLAPFTVAKPRTTLLFAKTEAEARDMCRSYGVQCAAICMQYPAYQTAEGRCPEAPRVWMRPGR